MLKSSIKCGPIVLDDIFESVVLLPKNGLKWVVYQKKWLKVKYGVRFISIFKNGNKYVLCLYKTWSSAKLKLKKTCTNNYCQRLWNSGFRIPFLSLTITIFFLRSSPQEMSMYFNFIKCLNNFQLWKKGFLE